MSDGARPTHFRPEDLLAHADWARSLAGHLVRDAADADDLVQDALAAAIRKPPLADRPLRPWFAAVLRRLALARRRTDGRRARRDAETGGIAAARSEPSAADVLARLDAHRALAELVAQLSEPLRATVYLRYYEGLDSPQIAQRHGVPAATVRWRLAKALEELRARLDARSGGDRSAWIAVLVPIAATPPTPAAPKPATAAASLATVLSGVLAMGTVTKILAGAAALVATLFVLARTDVVDVPGISRGHGRAAVAPIAARPEPREEPVRRERRRGAAETPAPAEDDAVAAAAPEKSLAGHHLEVRAHILDSLGSAAAGSRIEFLGSPSRPHADGGADGRVKLDLELTDAAPRLEFGVAAMRCATRVVGPAPAPDGDVLDLGDVQLDAGGSVTGRVVDTDGAPVAGAWIGVPDGDDPSHSDDDWRRQVGRVGTLAAPSALSDDDGRFTLVGVPVGMTRLWAGHDGFLASGGAPVEVRIGAASYGLVIALERLDPASLVRGIVRAPDGTGVAKAVVSYRYETGSMTGSGSVSADGDGRFLVLGAKNAAWRVTARDTKGVFAPAPAQEVRSGGGDVVLRLTEPKWVDVAALRGDGAAVERYALGLSTAEGLRIESLPEESHADGKARIRLPASPFRVEVTAPGYDVATAGPIDPAKAGDRIEVRLAALPGVRGRVFAAGAPVTGAKVSLREFVKAGSYMTLDGFACSTSPLYGAEDVTRPDGSFSITLRDAGRYLVRVDAAGLAPAETGPFDLVPETGREGIEVAMTAGGAIEGRVVVSGGRIASGVIVGISRGDGEARTLRTGPDGSYRFEHLTQGPWLVRETDRVLVAGDSQMTVTTGDARFDRNCRVEDGAVTHFDLDLRTDAGPRVRGTLRIDGAAAGGWSVSLLSGSSLFAPDEGRRSSVDSEGAFRLGAPRAGDYLLRAQSLGGLAVFAPVTVGEGETPASLDLRTGRVEVRGAEAGAFLVLVGEDAAGRCALAGVSPGADGTFTIQQFAAGRVRIARPDAGEGDPRRWPAVAKGDLAAGGTLVLDAAK